MMMLRNKKNEFFLRGYLLGMKCCSWRLNLPFVMLKDKDEAVLWINFKD
jgi:hypothetical protein